MFSLTRESSELQTSLDDDDDFFIPLSRKSPTAGQTAQAGSNGTTFPWPQAAVAQPAYESEDGFTDFISHEGPSSCVTEVCNTSLGEDSQTLPKNFSDLHMNENHRVELNGIEKSILTSFPASPRC